LLVASAVMFAISASITVRWCDPSCCGSTPMPGGWSLSNAWTRAANDTWIEAALAFLAMWTAMMIAMMLPSLVPMLIDDVRASVVRGVARSSTSIALTGVGYFVVWTALGIAVYPIGAVLASCALRSPELSRTVPILGGVALALGGALQLSRWKLRELSHCRTSSSCNATRASDANEASSSLHYGVVLGLHCVKCCSGFMLMLFAIGVMNVWAMAAIAVAMAAERVAPAPTSIVRSTGVLAIAAGACLVARDLLAR
jgi:predicted metal-binding membrane protein